MDIQSGRYCTVVVIDAVLFAIFGSSVFAMVAAFAVITVPAGAVTFTVRRTVHVVFGAMLPFRNKIIHVRWSGESAWIPLGDLETGLPFENHTSHPAPGQVLLYPGGFSETEILFPYGGTCFSSIVGQLAGNHFLTITSDLDKLYELGRAVLYEGAKTVRIEAV